MCVAYPSDEDMQRIRAAQRRAAMRLAGQRLAELAKAEREAFDFGVVPKVTADCPDCEKLSDELVPA